MINAEETRGIAMRHNYTQTKLRNMEESVSVCNKNGDEDCSTCVHFLEECGLVTMTRGEKGVWHCSRYCRRS